MTDASGLGDEGYGVGVAVGDINNDGFPDVYVTNYGKDALYLNEGNGHFRNITDEAGVMHERWSAGRVLSTTTETAGWTCTWPTTSTTSRRGPAFGRVGPPRLLRPGVVRQVGATACSAI